MMFHTTLLLVKALKQGYIISRANRPNDVRTGMHYIFGRHSCLYTLLMLCKKTFKYENQLLKASEGRRSNS